jgi:hypothetical protein
VIKLTKANGWRTFALPVSMIGAILLSIVYLQHVCGGGLI